MESLKCRAGWSLPRIFLLSFMNVQLLAFSPSLDFPGSLHAACQKASAVLAKESAEACFHIKNLVQV
jgi:hypothetical protein